MQKIKNIEFLRVFLIVTIVLFHMELSLNKLHTVFFHNMHTSMDYARNAVEAFFIIAGFFLILTFKNLPVWEFIKKKYFRLMPAAMFSVIVCAIGWILNVFHFKFIPNFLSGTLLCCFGRFWCKGLNVALWYSSALFFGFIVFYLIIKFTKEKCQIPIFILIAFISYLLLSVLYHGDYRGYYIIFWGIVSGSTLRAFGGIAIGCIIAKLYQKYKDKIANYSLNILQSGFFSMLEILSFGFIIWWAYFKHLKMDNIVFVISFIILFVLFLFKQGFISKITDKMFWGHISKYSYSLFVIHMPVIKIFYKKVLIPNKIFVLHHPFETMFITLIITFVCALITYYFIEKPSYKYLCKAYIKQ